MPFFQKPTLIATTSSKLRAENGLKFMGGLTCFNNNSEVAQNPRLHPVCRDGRLRPQMNWYLGITPTCQSYAAARLDALRRMVTTYQLDGVWLDFIRWPLHWEQELRDDTPPPLESSFDNHTIECFAVSADLDIPAGSPAERADWILRTHEDKWIDFKCWIITEFVARAKAIVDTHLAGKPLGLDIVPARSRQREHLLGQRLGELSAHADYFSPMLYHDALGFSIGWMTEILDESAAQSDKPLIPFVQVDTFSKDGEPFSARKWEKILNRVQSHAACEGLIAFTGDMLHRNGRGRFMANLLRHRIASSA